MGLVSVYITAVSFEDTRMVRLISYAWTMVPQIFYTGWIDPYKCKTYRIDPALQFPLEIALIY